MEVSDHFISGTVFDDHISFLDLVSYKEISDIQCSGPLAGAFPAILFQYNSTLVVLVQYVCQNLEALGFQEQFGP